MCLYINIDKVPLIMATLFCGSFSSCSSICPSKKKKKIDNVHNHKGHKDINSKYMKINKKGEKMQYKISF